MTAMWKKKVFLIRRESCGTGGFVDDWRSVRFTFAAVQVPIESEVELCEGRALRGFSKI